ncbi:hypothetical protein RJT34_17452 [Clitoria ternatea]|uniref:Uncharacterized protein n=1 Tax=Clitoria ternatea TaxID=43366 RepID=A0AAN9J9E1_CLITE
MDLYIIFPLFLLFTPLPSLCIYRFGKGKGKGMAHISLSTPKVYLWHRETELEKRRNLKVDIDLSRRSRQSKLRLTVTPPVFLDTKASVTTRGPESVNAFPTFQYKLRLQHNIKSHSHTLTPFTLFIIFIIIILIIFPSLFLFFLTLQTHC